MPQPSRVVLLVDDETALLSIFASGLTQAGFRVITAPTASVARQRAAVRVDVLATDIVLPDRLRLAKDHLQRPTLNGIALMRQLLAVQPWLKVLLFSGQPNDEIQRVGGIPPGTPFLRKPFSTETLLRTIRQILDTPQQGPGSVRHEDRPLTR